MNTGMPSQEPLATNDGKWPRLPVAIKHGVGVQIGDYAYVGLGTAGAGFYALDLSNPQNGWTAKASFPGPVMNSSAAVASKGKIYIFGGNGKLTPDAESAIIFDSVYVYDLKVDCWNTVPTQTPVGLSGAKAFSLPDGRIAIAGGYNKQLFDGFLAQVAALDRHPDADAKQILFNAYMGMQPEAYQWNSQLLCYDPDLNEWSSFGDNPFLPNCDSSLVEINPFDFLLLSGEIKPGLRTPAVKMLKFHDNSFEWQRLADLPNISADSMQEGVAGAFAAVVGGKVVLAGGVNFKGARANFSAGKTYAHKGLTKCWRDEIYVFDGKDWRITTRKLPLGLGYGMTFSIADGVLIVGGESAGGEPHSEVFLIKIDNYDINID